MPSKQLTDCSYKNSAELLSLYFLLTIRIVCALLVKTRTRYQQKRGERTMLEREDYEEFRKAVRRLAETKIQPYAADVDEKKRFPEEALAAFKELQLVALPFDERVGGQSGDVLAQSICLVRIPANVNAHSG